MATKRSSSKKSKTKKKSDKTEKSLKPTCLPSEWFDDMPTPIFILDESGQVLYANDAFCDLIKRKKKECLTVKPMDMMIEQGENRKFLKDLLQVYKGETIRRGIYNLTIAKKSFKTLLDIAPVYDNKRKLVRYAVGVVLDHNANKKMKRIRNFFKL
ncbi:PAS domain-containing protein [Candidatus Uhrbacteria bacterium]|nr:PAS domain-containing protein [Candidatus Uhrbacteria bacterium]